MELNDIKTTWSTVESPRVSDQEIRDMASEKMHPVLSGIRKQLTIEIIAWSIFLICYYSMFDGDKKPVWINIVLVLSVLIPIIHNLLGYRIAKYPVQGTNIRESLNRYKSKVKVYAIASIITRQIYLSGFLLFFFNGVNFNPGKYISLAIIISIFLVQLFISYRIWAKRVKILGSALTSFR
ncbi:hypothetical protein FAZ15_02575 [Sphingobacterium olei]|uniref:Uncharacterized protein n=1 Tax=Sphingobacterium olei TaxID=2571155 RepID=A0A4U0P6V8_9SPHI|nr:hypothetical protein [Sphingobacterium olei]TJZ63197.1 hypothetical protein FAZ15_02575 [Sphingobacterium olei]